MTNFPTDAEIDAMNDATLETFIDSITNRLEDRADKDAIVLFRKLDDYMTRHARRFL